MERVGRYRVLGEVARGGAGVVLRAEDPEGRRVALKLLLAGRLASAAQRGRFQAEARALRQVCHPGVVALRDAGEHEGAPYLALEWVEGETLAERVTRQGPLRLSEAVELVASLADALAHCHGQGVLHRDLKPDNVLVRADSGQPCLTDFGLARLILPGAEAGLTATGCWLGTPGWWPPEQARGQLDRIGPASDVYGLGALLFGLLTGHVPQEGQDLQEQLRALDRPPTPPSRHRRDLPGWVDALVVRAMDPDPARRPRDAAAFAALLRRGAMTARPRRRAWLVAGALALLAAGSPLAWRAWRARAAEAHVARGIALARAGELDAALAALERALEVSPSSSRALVRRAILRLDLRHDVEGARRDLAALREQGPLDSLGLSLSGWLHVLDGDEDAACADLDRAIALASTEALPYAQRGVLRLNRGDAAGAVRDLDRALELAHVADAGVLLTRSRARVALGDFQGGLEDARRAQELAPGLAPLWNQSGLALKGLGQDEAALREFDRALELDPRADHALYNRARLRHRMGHKAGARADLDRLLELEPLVAETRLARGVLLMEEGDFRAGLADLERAVELSPNDPEIRAFRGKARVVLGDEPGGVADIERALELDPGCREALLCRSKVWLSRGQVAEAEQDLERLLAIDPGHAEGHLTRSAARQMKRDVPGAIRDLERALELAPQAAWAGQARREIELLRARLGR